MQVGDLVQVTEKGKVTPTCTHALLTRDVTLSAVGSQPKAEPSPLSPRECLSEGHPAMPDSGPSPCADWLQVHPILRWIHLLIQVMSLNEVTHIGVIFVSGQCVQVQ